MSKKVAISKQKAIFCLLALCVVGILYWAYATRPVVEEVAKPVDNTMTYTNNTLKEEVNGKLVWECYAETMSVDQTTQLVTMENIKGKFYREDGSSIEITADRGEYDQKAKRMILDKGIHAKSTDDMTFDTDKVTWDGNKGVLLCEGNVKITKPNLSASGDKAESKDAFQNFKLMGNAHIIKGDVGK